MTDRKEELRRRINSLSSQICRAKKAGEDTAALEAERAELQLEKKNLKNSEKVERVKKSLTTASPKVAPQIKVSKGTARNGFKFDEAAIQSAISEMGITRCVEFKWTGGIRRLGAMRLRWHNGITITVSGAAGRTKEEVNETIWHELKHAQQAEQYSSPVSFNQAYRSMGYSTWNTYWNNPFEVGARETGERNKTRDLVR